jgi:hypothetical protein
VPQLALSVITFVHAFEHTWPDPDGQLQAPVDEHVSPATLHVPQLAPPAPHALVVWLAYGTQEVPLQQPPGQDVALHTH